MAKLTDTLDTVNSGKRIVGPADNGPSFLEGLAKFGTQASSALAQGSANARQNKIFADQQETDKATNELETKFQDAKRAASERMRADPGVDGWLTDEQQVSAPLPDDVLNAERQLSRSQRGAAQGRISEDQMQLQMEKVWADLEHKFPDRVADMAKYMKSMGHDHYLFRDQQLQDQIQTADEHGIALGRAQAVEYATKNGLALPDMTPDQIYQRGAEAMGAAAMAEIMQKQASAAKDAKAAAQSDFKFTEGVNDRKTLAAVQAQAGAYLGSVLDVTSNLANSAKSDSQWKQLSDKQAEIDQGMDVYKSHTVQKMYASGATPEMVKAFETDVDIKKKAVQDIFFGPSSRFQQTHRAFTQMQNQLGLSTVDALPVYSMVNRILGSSGVAQVFSGDPQLGLSDKLMSQLKVELKAYDPTHPNQAISTLYQVGEIIKGNQKLSDQPESAYTGDKMKMLNSVLKGTALNIMDKEPDDPLEYSNFSNALGNLAIGAVRIQPGNKDYAAQNWAIGAIASPRNKAVLEKMLKDPATREQAMPLMMETRAGAAQILEVAKAENLVWNNGRFEPKKLPVKDNVGDTVNLPMDGSSYTPSSYRGKTPAGTYIDPQSQMQANTVNAALGYLIDTAPHDDSIPPGVTPLQLREHYALGKPWPEAKKDASGKAPANAWDTSFNRLEETLGHMNKDIQDALPFDTKVSFKSPRDAMIRTAIGEAGREGHVGMQAVAAVIANRAASSGQTPEEVVLARGQFEPWGNPKTSARLMAIEEDSPAYKKAAAAVDAALAGEDPTGGATHFYAPGLQSELGRNKPSWDDGTGTDIGNHRFFKHGYKG